MQSQTITDTLTVDPFAFLNTFLSPEKSPDPFPEGDEDDEEPKMVIKCMSIWKWYVDPATGMEKSYPLTCGKFRECEYCHDKRKDGFIRRIAIAIAFQNKRVAIMKLTDDDSNQLAQVSTIVKALDKGDYLRLPSEDGGALFFNANALPELPPDSAVLNNALELPTWFDWDDLTNTPEGSRPSGNLGKEDKDTEHENDENWSQIEVDIIELSERHSLQVSLAYSDAAADTIYLDPRTPEEVVTAVAQRTDALVNRLTERKIYVRSRKTRKVWIKHDSIDWKKFSGIYVTSGTCIHDRESAKNGQNTPAKRHT